MTTNFELVRLINRTCNFRTEVYTEPYETSKIELFVKIVKGFKPLIFTKKLHLDKVLNMPLQKKPFEKCSEK